MNLTILSAPVQLCLDLTDSESKVLTLGVRYRISRERLSDSDNQDTLVAGETDE